MKAFKLNCMMLLVALVFSSVPVFAQQNENEDVKDEEVIIIKEVIDNDGNVEIKTITRTADTEDIIIKTINGVDFEIHENLDELENVHIIKVEELEGLSDELQEQLKDINIEFDEIDEDRHIKIILDSKVGDEEPVIIEWKGEGEIPEDIKQQMEEHGVLMNGEGFGHVGSHGFIKGNHAKNKACLGVMIGKTVENINGVETVNGGSDEGVAILDVFENSGADDAGLLKDDVIVAINGTDVVSISDVLTVLKPYEGGEKIAIAYLRNEEPVLVNATLKACENKVKIENVESLGENDFELDEEVNWVFEKETEGEQQIKRTIIIKKASKENTEEVQESEATPVPENDAAGIETPDDVIFTSTEDLDKTLELQDFSLYPNPTAGNLNVAFQSEAVPTIVRIMDITGKEIYKEEINDFKGSYKKEINLSEVPKGALMLTIMQNNRVFADKIMVQ